MIFQFPGLPPPPPAVPTGPGAQLTLLLLFGVLLIALAYFFFGLCDAPRSEEFWRNVEQLQARRRGKKWWQL